MAQESNKGMQIPNLFSVEGKTAIVSGGGTGIGLMCAQALAVNGAKVYIIGRRKEKLETVANEYGKNIKGSIIPLQGDVTSKDDIKRIIKDIESKETSGKLHILVNNAGKGSGIQSTRAKTAEEMAQNLFHSENATMENWTDTYQTNVPHVFFMTMGFLPMLQRASDNGEDGNVINISSISGIVKLSQDHVAYNASKASVVYLTKMIGNEIQANGLKVRVNSIAPGIFPSELTTGGQSNEYNKSDAPADHFWEGQVPAERPGTEQDMANAVLFMATNKYLYSQTVSVDGGYILRQGA